MTRFNNNLDNLLFILVMGMVMNRLMRNQVMGLEVINQELEITGQFILYDNEVVTLTNASLVFIDQDPDIPFSHNISFQLSYDCSIRSLYKPISIYSSYISGISFGVTSTLKLVNTTLSVNQYVFFNDYKIDMSQGQNEFIVNKSAAYFDFKYLTYGETLFSGGAIRIFQEDKTYYAGLIIRADPILPSDMLATITSTIYNSRNFYSSVGLYIDGSILKGGNQVLCRYMFGNVVTGTNLNFTQCGSFVILSLDTKGHSVYTNSTSWDLGSNFTQLINTTMIVGPKTTIVSNMGPNTDVRMPMGMVYLDPNSYVVFADPFTTFTLINMYYYLMASALPYTSILITQISSPEGHIFCNGSTTSAYRNGTQRINPLVNVGYSTQLHIQSLHVCSNQATSFRLYLDFMLPEVNLWIPCNGSEIRCYLSNECSMVINCLGLYGFTCSNYSVQPQSQQASLATTIATSLGRSLMATDLIDPNNGNFTCWDSSCRPQISMCKPFPPCPVDLPLRCAGYCLPINGTCGPCPFPCPSRCFNTTMSECEAFLGCGYNEIQCPKNLACVKNASDCDFYGDKYIRLSYRALTSTGSIYNDSLSAMALWFINPKDPNIIKVTSQVNYPVGSFLSDTYYSNLYPYPDSLASLVNGSSIHPNFNYYINLLTPPFKLSITNYYYVADDQTPWVFQEHYTFFKPISIYFDNTFQTIHPNDMCLAFINDDNAWECTPFPVKPINNGTILETYTTHFSNFALLLRYNKPTDSSSGFGETSSKNNHQQVSNKTMIIISTSVVGGIILLVTIIAIIINFKLKHFSFRKLTYRQPASDIDKTRFKQQHFRAQ